MDKEFSVYSVVSRIHVIYRLILFSLCSVAIALADSGKTVTDIEAYFSDLDSALSALGQKVALSSVKQAKAPMENILQDYPGIAALIRSNSRGKVVNEVVREGKLGRPNRNLSRQKWYGKIKNLEPYYSSLKTGKVDLLLFWCKPIRIKKSGRDRCGGAIVARIDLKRSFDAVAKKVESPFRVLQKGQPFFSHSWKASYDSTALPLAIKGLADVHISVHEKKKVVEAKPPEPEKRERDFPLIIVIVFLSIGIVSFVVWSIIKVVVKKRHEALLRRIEGEEPSVETGKSFGEPKKKVLMADVKEVEATLPEKKEVVLEPEGSTVEEPEEVTQSEEVPYAAEKREEATEIPPTKQEAPTLDVIPEETVAIQPDFDFFIEEEKPDKEVSEMTAAASEEAPKTISQDIMGEVEALLQKHLNSVLAERVKQIEEDVLARVRDELAGRMKDNE